MKLGLYGGVTLFSLLGVAQADSPYKGDFYVGLGGYFPTVSTDVRLDGSGTGTTVDLEETLGLDDSDTSGLLEINYKFNDRHGVGFSYFALNRSGSKVIDGTINWGDQTYDVGAAVQSLFESKTYRIYYDYTFLTSDKYSLSLSAGLHITEIKVGLGLLGAIDGDVVAGTSESTSFTAPLPVFGLRGAYRVSTSWLLRGKAEYFALDTGTASGSITNVGLGVQYDGFEYVMLGLDYDYFGVNAEDNDGALHSEINFSYHGPMLTIGAYF